MNDYIVFTVCNNYYALPVASIQRIIQVPPITAIPNAHPFVDGMMSYEKRVTKVVNFRKMMELSSHEEELCQLFKTVQDDHEIWVNSLCTALQENKEFTLTLDPHACRLGKWLDSYSTHDENVLAILKVLRPAHARLHERGKELLELRETNPQAAIEGCEQEIGNLYGTTVAQLKRMGEMAAEVSSQTQKLLIYQKEEGFFGIKVDQIEDIVSIDPSELKHVDRMDGTHFVELDGVVELGERLVNIIKSVSMPIKESV